MKRDWRIRNMGLILGVAVCLLPSAAWAQKPEPALVCQPDSGFWQEENGLDVLEEICPLSARVVVNQVSLRMEHERILNILDQLNNLIQNEK